MTLCACHGLIDEPAALPPDERGVVVRCEEPMTAASALRHLSRIEYRFAVEDLFGIAGADSAPAMLAPDDVSTGFEVGNLMSDLLAQQYLDVAEAVASAVELDALASCDPASRGEEVCAREVLVPLAQRAFRRDLALEEIAELVQTFREGRDLSGTYDEGLRHAVAGVLVSPHFLYHLELDTEGAAAGEVVPVPGFQLASRLSFFLWRSVPDETLLDAARTGELADEAGLLAQIDRMLSDPRSRRGTHDFFRQWLKLDGLSSIERSPDYYPGFTREHAVELRASLEAYLDEIMREDPTLDALLTSTFGHVSPEIAPNFGVEPPSDSGLTRVELDPAQRAGILTHPALLTLLGKPSQSDPIHRGVFVRTQLLCQSLPLPPNDVVPLVPEPVPGQTTRDRFDAHREDPACAGCHQLIDPVGFGFEHYDAIGRWRDRDDDQPIDASGEVVSGADASGSFYGAVELAHQLAASDVVRDCVASQWTRFALNRSAALGGDACTAQQVEQRFARSAGDFRELVLAIITSPSFLYRQALEAR